MIKKILTGAAFFLTVTGTATANALPEVNWSAMSPTVQIVSYQYKPAGFVTAMSSGSGTVISPDGLILTNNHVIFDETEQKPLDGFEVCVTFDAKKQPLCQYTATLVANNEELDLALLQMEKQDVFGDALPSLKYLDYSPSPAPTEGQAVQVIGYPASGGETITATRGQISGFDTFNGYKYFKTDTDFDHGSSGGTVLDGAGRFIGVPTYIRSYAENVGYFLDLNEGRSWIETHAKDETKGKEKAMAELRRDLARFVRANKTLQYKTESAPTVEIKLPEGWTFFQIENDNLFAGQKNVNDGVGVSLRLEERAFPIDDGYLNKLDEQFIGARDRFPDFKKESVIFADAEGLRFSYTSYNQKNTIIYIPRGRFLIGVSYAVNLDKETEQMKALQPVLESIRFGETEEAPAASKTVRYDEPPFEFTAFGDFRIQKPLGPGEGDRMVKAVQENNYEGDFSVYYSFIPRDAQTLSEQEKLDEETKGIAEQGMKLIAKKDDVTLDGMEGYLYAFEYEGERYQKMRKRLIVKLNAGDHELSMEYDDLSDNFDTNLPLIRQMLSSFRWLGETKGKKGTYEFGALGHRFTDVQNHRFAAAIAELADKGIAEGYSDGRFRPEFFARQADALKMILFSKNKLEQERGLGNEVVFDDYAGEANEKAFEKYLNYMRERNLFEPGEPFEPYVAITLGQALKWIAAVYELPVWQGEARSPYKSYMDKGYELGLIPRGLDGEDAKLTRAELSEIVDTVYNQAK